MQNTVISLAADCIVWVFVIPKSFFPPSKEPFMADIEEITAFTSLKLVNSLCEESS